MNLIQNTPGIYVYRYSDELLNPGFKVDFYASLNGLFLTYSEWSLANIFTGSINDTRRSAIYSPTSRRLINYCVAYDEEGNWFAPDRLVGAYRVWLKNRYKNYRYKYQYRRKQAYGGHRAVKTTQERRMAFVDPDANDIGVTIKMRCARNATNLVNAWDDICSDAQKSWKYQAKKRYQWM